MSDKQRVPTASPQPRLPSPLAYGGQGTEWGGHRRPGGPGPGPPPRSCSCYEQTGFRWAGLGTAAECSFDPLRSTWRHCQGPSWRGSAPGPPQVSDVLSPSCPGGHLLICSSFSFHPSSCHGDALAASALPWAWDAEGDTAERNASCLPWAWLLSTWGLPGSLECLLPHPGLAVTHSHPSLAQPPLTPAHAGHVKCGCLEVETRRLGQL